MQRTIATTLILIAAAGMALADDPPVPPPTRPRISLGLGVVSTPAPYVGADNNVLPFPLVELNYSASTCRESAPASAYWEMTGCTSTSASAGISSSSIPTILPIWRD